MLCCGIRDIRYFRAAIQQHNAGDLSRRYTVRRIAPMPGIRTTRLAHFDLAREAAHKFRRAEQSGIVQKSKVPAVVSRDSPDH